MGIVSTNARHYSGVAAGSGAEPGSSDVGSSWLFALLLLFVVLEYARPPLIVVLRLQMLISLLLPLAWLVHHQERPWSPLLSIQVAFLAYCAAMVPWVHNNYAAYFTSRVMFGNVAIAIAMSWMLSTRERLVQGVWAWLLVMSYVAFYGLTHGGRGPGGFLGDENDLALACATAFPFAFYGFEWMRGRRRWASLVLGGLLVLAIVTSFSRSGFVGLAAAALYCVVTARYRLRSIAIGVFAALAFLAVSPQSYIDELRTITEVNQGTAKGRRFLWATAVNMWKDHPILGVGGGNFNFLAGDYQPTTFEGREYHERNWSGITVHSLYYQVLSEHGLVGVGLLGAFGFLYFRTLRRLRRRVRQDRHTDPELQQYVELYAGALEGAMVGYLGAGAFLSVLTYPYPWYFAGMAVALQVSVGRELEKRRPVRAHVSAAA